MKPSIEQSAAVLAHEVAQYANKQGETWRTGEGTEIMDALQSYQESASAHQEMLRQYTRKVLGLTGAKT
jgi:hypothetical protein